MRYDAGAAAKADDIFMRALLCEGAVSALERYAHAFHDVQLTARISTPKEFHARNARVPARIFRDNLKFTFDHDEEYTKRSRTSLL